MRGFALSLLVDETNYNALASHINGVHLGQRLVYNRTGRAEAASARPLRVNSLLLKLNVKQGPFAKWLEADLRNRFDYECVDSMRTFRSTGERALTREGQVKHSATRHEKDDRSPIDARRNWVLGFDNREKLALYEHQDRELEANILALSDELDSLRAQQQKAAVRSLHCQTLANLQWQEINALPIVDRIAARLTAI
ncbi:hypothetical protein LP420_22225 [Massilia sp. B-10]|nr:hypothetical protein LP420_22225 [Massilia sp. B-10]